jgi:hypothetical protein
VELRDRAHPRLRPPRGRALRGLLLLLALALALPAGALADTQLELPKSQATPPPSYERSAREVKRIAAAAEKVREASREGPLRPTAYTRGFGRWQVSFFRGKDEVVQVHVDDASGRVVEQWSGHQVSWRMARGYEGAFARKLNAPYVWIPLCLLFLAPFVDFRRPLRLLHLDLLALLAFGVSHFFFNRGEIGLSVPLAYPVLAYLLVRMLLAGFRPRERAGALVPHVSAAWLAIALVFLVAFRIGLNLTDSNVIDVGYAGVIGADRIADGDELYGRGFSEDVERGDTYGPLAYLLYMPAEQALSWSGGWDDLPAAHATAIGFDLLAIAGLLLLGRLMRPAREGRDLGLALAYAWAAYPYTAFALETNSNDTLVALACIAALLAWCRRSALGAGVAVGLGAAAKFAPLVLAPLFARRSPLVFGAALLAALALLFLPFLPNGGLAELYDRTLGYQAGRDSPFSVWGQVGSLDWLHTALKLATVGLGLLVGLLPRAPSDRQLAALGAAVLVALQLVATHWFYLYVVWITPFVLVAVMGELRRVPAEPHAEPERGLVAA